MGARKRIKAEERKEAMKSIAIAKLNNCPTSPRKMRLVADTVRGKDVFEAFLCRAGRPGFICENGDCIERGEVILIMIITMNSMLIMM